MPEPTPGQLAYEAYMRDAHPGEHQPWSWLEWRDQHGWEAAAQAVLDAARAAADSAHT